MKFSSISLAVCLFGAIGRADLPPSREADHSWDVAVINKILAQVRPGQQIVPVGDMGFKVTVLEAWRDHLASTSLMFVAGAGRRPNSAFAGGVVTWTSGTIPYVFDAAITAPRRQAFLDAAGEWALFANLHLYPAHHPDQLLVSPERARWLR